MSKNSYPWSSLTEVGQTFEVTSVEGKKYISQLIYAVNTKGAKLGTGVKYRFYRDGEKCMVERIA